MAFHPGLHQESSPRPAYMAHSKPLPQTPPSWYSSSDGGSSPQQSPLSEFGVGASGLASTLRKRLTTSPTQPASPLVNGRAVTVKAAIDRFEAKLATLGDSADAEELANDYQPFDPPLRSASLRKRGAQRLELMNSPLAAESLVADLGRNEDTVQPWQMALAFSEAPPPDPGSMALERANSALARQESLARLTGTRTGPPPSSKGLPDFLLAKHREEAERRGYQPASPSGGEADLTLPLPLGDAHGLGFSVGPGGRGVPRLSALQRKALEKIANGQIVGGAALSRSHTTTGTEARRPQIGRLNMGALGKRMDANLSPSTSPEPTSIDWAPLGADARSAARSNLMRKLSSRAPNGATTGAAETLQAEESLQVPHLGLRSRPRSGSLSDLPTMTRAWARVAVAPSHDIPTPDAEAAELIQEHLHDAYHLVPEDDYHLPHISWLPPDSQGPLENLVATVGGRSLSVALTSSPRSPQTSALGLETAHVPPSQLVSGLEIRRTSASPTHDAETSTATLASPNHNASLSPAIHMTTPEGASTLPYSPSPTSASKRTSGVSNFTTTSEFRAYRHSEERDRDSILDWLGYGNDSGPEWDDYVGRWESKSELAGKSGNPTPPNVSHGSPLSEHSRNLPSPSLLDHTTTDTAGHGHILSVGMTSTRARSEASDRLSSELSHLSSTEAPFTGPLTTSTSCSLHDIEPTPDSKNLYNHNEFEDLTFPSTSSDASPEVDVDETFMRGTPDVLGLEAPSAFISSHFDSLESFPASVSSLRSVTNSGTSSNTASTAPGKFSNSNGISHEFRFPRPPPLNGTKVKETAPLNVIKSPTSAQWRTVESCKEANNVDPAYSARVNRVFEEMTRSNSVKTPTEKTDSKSKLAVHQHSESLSSSTINSKPQLLSRGSASPAESVVPTADAATLAKYIDDKLAPFPALLPTSASTSSTSPPGPSPTGQECHSRNQSGSSTKSVRAGAKSGFLSSASTLVSTLRSKSRKRSEPNLSSPLSSLNTPTSAQYGGGDSPLLDRDNPLWSSPSNRGRKRSVGNINEVKRQKSTRMLGLFLQQNKTTQPIGSTLTTKTPSRRFINAFPALQARSQKVFRERQLFLFSDLLIIGRQCPEDDDMSHHSPSTGKKLSRYLISAATPLWDLGMRIPHDPMEIEETSWHQKFVDQFSTNADTAIAHLQEIGVIDESSEAIARVLHDVWALNRQHVAAYLAEPEHSDILAAYLGDLSLHGLQLDEAIRVLIQSIHVPVQHAFIDCLLDDLAAAWVNANPDCEMNVEMTALLISLIMDLNAALHSELAPRIESRHTGQIGNRIGRAHFTETVSSHMDDAFMDEDLLDDIYGAVKRNCIYQAPIIAADAPQIQVQGMPSRILCHKASSTITVTLPAPDKWFSIKLHGEGLVMEPPTLHFSDSASASFTVKASKLGRHALIFMKVGTSAHKYSGLCTSKSLICEQTSLQQTAFLTYNDLRGVSRDSCFAFSTPELRSHFLTTLEEARQNLPPKPSERIQQVVMEALRSSLSPFGVECKLSSKGTMVKSPSSNAQMTRSDSVSNHRSSPSNYRIAETIGSPMLRAMNSADIVVEDGSVDGSFTVGEVVMLCEQNSLLPSVLDFLEAGHS